MNALVPLQSSGVTESSLAVDTDVRFLPTVDPQVSLEISFKIKKSRGMFLNL